MLKLCDEKVLKLDDPVSKWVSYVPHGSTITLRMLANMTSGLHSYTEVDSFVKALITDPNKVWTPEQLVRVGVKHAPDFLPGKGWHYSNTNTVLLGLIIQQATKKKIGDVFAQMLFQPLGLKNTTWPRGGALPLPYAHGITEQTLDGKPADATHWNPSWAFTAGAIVSTMADLRVWVKSYTTGSLISPEMQKERTTWVKLPPNTPDRAYGLGLGIDRGWLGHTGELPGYNCGGYYLPSQDATVVIMVNSDIPVGKANPMPLLFKRLAAFLTPANVPT